MTAQEGLVWAQLRELNRMLGLHFRRQAPIGAFIADFADLGRRVVIEVDGVGHGGPRDAVRDEWLASQGFQVLRFWNHEVSGNIEGVMHVIFDAIGGEAWADGVPPTPVPSPRGGGEATRSRVPRTMERATPPSPLVGEEWGGGASAKGEAIGLERTPPAESAFPPPCGEGMGVGVRTAGKAKGNP